MINLTYYVVKLHVIRIFFILDNRKFTENGLDRLIQQNVRKASFYRIKKEYMKNAFFLHDKW